MIPNLGKYIARAGTTRPSWMEVENNTRNFLDNCNDLKLLNVNLPYDTASALLNL